MDEQVRKEDFHKVEVKPIIGEIVNVMEQSYCNSTSCGCDEIGDGCNDND